MLISDKEPFSQEINADDQRNGSFSAHCRPHQTNTLVLGEKIKNTLPDCFHWKWAAQILSLPKHADTDISEQGLQWIWAFQAGFHENAGFHAQNRVYEYQHGRRQSHEILNVLQLKFARK